MILHLEGSVCYITYTAPLIAIDPQTGQPKFSGPFCAVHTSIYNTHGSPCKKNSPRGCSACVKAKEVALKTKLLRDPLRQTNHCRKKGQGEMDDSTESRAVSTAIFYYSDTGHAPGNSMSHSSASGEQEDEDDQGDDDSTDKKTVRICSRFFSFKL